MKDESMKELNKMIRAFINDNHGKIITHAGMTYKLRVLAQRAMKYQFDKGRSFGMKARKNISKIPRFYTLKDLSEEFDRNLSTVYTRLGSGLTLREALTRPVEPKDHEEKRVYYGD